MNTTHTHNLQFFCELEKSDDDDGSGGAKDPTKKNFVNLFKFPYIRMEGNFRSYSVGICCLHKFYIIERKTVKKISRNFELQLKQRYD